MPAPASHLFSKEGQGWFVIFIELKLKTLKTLRSRESKEGQGWFV